MLYVDKRGLHHKKFVEQITTLHQVVQSILSKDEMFMNFS